MSAERAPIKVLRRGEQSGGAVSVIESGSLPGFGGPPLHHPYTNLSDAPTGHLIACTPAGFECYFARMAAERQGEKLPEWALRPIPWSTTVGPRIGERRDGGQ